MNYKKLAKNKIFLVFAVLIVLIFAYLGYTYFSGQGQMLPTTFRRLTGLPTGTTTPTPTPKPTPRPIGTGRQEFNVSMSKDTWPKMSKVVTDPIDPKLLQKQTISVEANDTAPINSITATLKLNDKTKVINMALVEGTNLQGRWEGSWTASGGYDELYHLVIEAVSATGKSSIDMAIR